MWYGSFDLHYREKIRIIKLPVIVVDSTNLQHSSWEIWNDAEEWFCFIGFDSGWRDGVCCFHIAIAMIYSDDFCVSEFFVREIRKNSQVPIILLTVNNMEVDIVTGLDAGANDYITKPFSLMVLRARVSVQLRNKDAVVKNSMEFDGFEFYFDKMEFFKNGELIELSKTEQKLLKVLCENRGKVVKREYLIDEVWQGDTEFVDAHALTVAVKRLRDKLEDDTQKPKYIKTVYGIGYTWAVNR